MLRPIEHPGRDVEGSGFEGQIGNRNRLDGPPQNAFVGACHADITLETTATEESVRRQWLHGYGYQAWRTIDHRNIGQSFACRWLLRVNVEHAYGNIVWNF